MRIVRLGCLLALALLSAQLLLADEVLDQSSAGIVLRYSYDSGGTHLIVTPDTNTMDAPSDGCSVSQCEDTGMDTLGKVYRYDYNMSGYPAEYTQSSQYTDSRGNVTRYTYDSGDSPDHSSAGLTVQYTYDGNSYTAHVDTIEAITPSMGATYYTYDGNFDGPGPGNTTRFTYDDTPLKCDGTADPCTTQTLYDNRGNTTVYAYDSGIQKGLVFTPEPSSLLLLFTGVVGLVGLLKRKR